MNSNFFPKHQAEQTVQANVMPALMANINILKAAAELTGSESAANILRAGVSIYLRDSSATSDFHPQTNAGDILLNALPDALKSIIFQCFNVLDIGLASQLITENELRDFAEGKSDLALFSSATR